MIHYIHYIYRIIFVLFYYIIKILYVKSLQIYYIKHNIVIQIFEMAAYIWKGTLLIMCSIIDYNTTRVLLTLSWLRKA